ncbi:MAG: CAP domain-containing protein [Chloroflexota bacterium]
MQRWFVLFLILIGLGGSVAAAAAQSGYFPVSQSDALAHEEGQVVHLTNLERAARGIPPLRWNWQLTQSARWFAADKAAMPDCENAHRDTLGNFPDVRAQAFGYPGSAGAENVWCVYLPPAPAVAGWLTSQTGHATNLLSPDHREVGIGYSQNGEGWLAQDFGSDHPFAPLVVDNEALSTDDRQVDLYLYDRPGGELFTALQSAVSMQVSEDACFNQAAVLPYQPRFSFTLSAGEGWKRIYARTRDAYGRSLTVDDSIYLGNLTANQPLGEEIFSTTRPSVSLYDLNPQGRSHIQLSLGWLGDAFKTGKNALLPLMTDPAALNGKAVQLPHNRNDGSDPNMTWVWTTTFFTQQPMVAYFRLKVNSLPDGEAVRLSVTGGTFQSGEVILRGSDFPSPNTYIDVPIPFTFSPDPVNPFLIFKIRRTGSAEVTIDTVTIFTAPQRFNGSPFVWQVPGGAYRGEGVWVRFSAFDGSQFTPLREAAVSQRDGCLMPASLTVLADASSDPPLLSALVLPSYMAGDGWNVEENLPWLQAARAGGKVELRLLTRGLGTGQYNGEVIVRPTEQAYPPLRLTVRLLMVERVYETYLPALNR